MSALLDLLFAAQRLKITPRTGWVMRGVSAAESVADHSFGVAFIAMLLAETVEGPVDKAKVLTIALLHDLAESVIGDIPAPVAVYFPPDAKREAEEAVLKQLLASLPAAERWHTWWREFEESSGLEGRIVREADRLDMLIQAHVYEQTTGNRRLGEFWPAPNETPFTLPAAQELYARLLDLRRSSDVVSRLERDSE